MRLDKYLAQMSVGTRSEVKKIIKSGRVFVNEILAERPEQQVSREDSVTVDGQPVDYTEYEYYMLNKPQGYVSAVTDNTADTVVSLIQDSKKKGLFPVGRLDKDTEGLLLITNDGALAHELLSPKKHVWKTYLVKALGNVTEADRQQLEQGLDIGDKRKTLPAKARVVDDVAAVWPPQAHVTETERQNGDAERMVSEDGTEYTWLELTIREGRFHQVKRMMEAVGKPVVYLKRISMGSLCLDRDLKPGEYRKLTEEEKQCFYHKI